MNIHQIIKLTFFAFPTYGISKYAYEEYQLYKKYNDVTPEEKLNREERNVESELRSRLRRQRLIDVHGIDPIDEMDGYMNVLLREINRMYIEENSKIKEDVQSYVDFKTNYFKARKNWRLAGSRIGIESYIEAEYMERCKVIAKKRIQLEEKQAMEKRVNGNSK